MMFFFLKTKFTFLFVFQWLIRFDSLKRYGLIWQRQLHLSLIEIPYFPSVILVPMQLCLVHLNITLGLFSIYHFFMRLIKSGLSFTLTNLASTGYSNCVLWYIT